MAKMAGSLAARRVPTQTQSRPEAALPETPRTESIALAKALNVSLGAGEGARDRVPQAPRLRRFISARVSFGRPDGVP